jgi:hypothetical protein
VHHSLRIIGAIAVLAIAVAGGFAATSMFQRTVPIVPGVQGCWRLEGSTRQVDCISDQFANGAREASSGLSGAARDRAVLAYVGRADKLAANDARLGGVCHPAMHVLGRTEGARAAAAGHAPTFPDGSTQLCTAGFVHGLAEGYLARTPNADVAAVFPKLCHDAAARAGCAHGIGHALLRAQRGSSAASTTNAIAGCAKLPSEFPNDCHNGVFMELAMRTTPRAVPVASYVDACTAADSQADVALGLSCWGYLGLSLASNDVPLEQQASWCAKASPAGQFTCIEGYGRDLGVARVANCSAKGVGRTAIMERCIDGAVGLQVGSGHVTAAAARASCTNLGTKHLAAYCRSAVGRYSRGRAATAGGGDSNASASMTPVAMPTR